MLRSHPRVIWYGSKKCSGLSDQLSRGAEGPSEGLEYEETLSYQIELEDSSSICWLTRHIALKLKDSVVPVRIAKRAASLSIQEIPTLFSSWVWSLFLTVTYANISIWHIIWSPTSFIQSSTSASSGAPQRHVSLMYKGCKPLHLPKLALIPRHHLWK